MPDRPDHGVARGLFAARLTASLMPLNSTMIAVAVPDVARELGHSLSAVTQALVATYLVTAIALQTSGGKLADRLGPWRVLSLGQVVIGAGALLGYVAGDLTTLTVARVLIACGGALVVPATVAVLRLELPPERRGRAFGTFGAAMALAAAVGPVLGGVLVDAFSWKAVFLGNLPVLGIAALGVIGLPRAAVTAPVTRFDGGGSVLLTLALALVVLGAQGERAASLVLVTVGLLLLLGFAWWQTRAEDPLVDLTLFRSLPFAAGSSLIASQNLVMYGLLFELPLVIDALFALSASATGRLLTSLMAAMVVTSLLAGRLTDRAGPRPVALGGTLVCLAGLVLLRGSDLSAPGDVRLPLVLLGAGLGLSSPAAQTASMSAVASWQSGMAAGAASTMRYLGAVFGIALLGRVLDLDGDRAQVLGEHQHVLSLFTVVLLVSAVCAAVLPGRHAVSADPQVRRAGQQRHA